MRKRMTTLLIVAAVLVSVGVGTTVALLVAASNPVVNTFTVGGVDITLHETTGSEYTMTPGVTVEKDPTVTVRANSEHSWLFVKVEKSRGFDTFCTCEMEAGWTALAGQAGVYYRTVGKSTSDQHFPVLKDNAIHISSSLTEEQLNAVTENPTLSITAYAAQSDGIATAADAWQVLNEGEEA